MTESHTHSLRPAAVPLVALSIASAFCVVLVGLRILWTGHLAYWFLAGNLCLAWLPLAFALGVWRQCQNGAAKTWKLGSLAALWLLFFPNAPYLFTDLIHLNGRFQEHYWVDLSLILLIAFTGFMAGFLSLYLMQSLVVRRAGKLAGWLFVMLVAEASGVGIYIGRFLRWNSWDALLHPFGITRDLGHVAAHPLAHSSSLAFALLFATFLFLGYLMLYALTHLQPARMQEPAVG